jgi:putative NADH-flavin reductase
MPRIYAVLGATGNCGTALIQLLLKDSDAHIRAFVRNKAKLIRLIPGIAEHKNVEIFEGSIHDVELITSCIRQAQAVFLCVSTNDNVPGCRMAQDTAISVIRGLEALKTHNETKDHFRAPRLVLLSSNTLDDQLSQHTPWLVRQILLRSASHVYKDLEETEKFLRAEQAWVQTVFIKPGGLSVDVQRGHRLSLTEEKSPLSYLDLAAGMIEAADDPEGKWDMQNVGVCYTSGEAQFPRGALMCISMGLVRHYFPFLHPYLPNTGPY